MISKFLPRMIALSSHCPAKYKGRPCILAKKHPKVRREVNGNTELWDHISMQEFWTAKETLARPVGKNIVSSEDVNGRA